MLVSTIRNSRFGARSLTAPASSGSRPAIFCGLIVAGLLAAGVTVDRTASSPLEGVRAQTGAVTASGAELQARQAYAQLPMRFEENRGQTDGRVQFLARGAGYGLFLTDREAVLSLAAPDHARTRRGAVLRMRLLGASGSSRGVGEGRLPGSTNHLVGRRPQRDVRAFGRVRYAGVYPGVDVVYYGNQNRLEYDFLVRPGADPRRIQLEFDGSRAMHLDRGGDLVLATAAGTVRQHRPVLYQRFGSQRRRVAGRYVVDGRGRVGIRVGRYDARRTLVIDPVVQYSTYLGGGFGDDGNAIAVDSSGSAYVAGATSSLDFPIRPGALDPTRGGAGSFADDGFVAKLNPQGSGLVYSTYLGGGGVDRVHGIALDGAGRAYLAGETSSEDFPKVNALQPTLPDSFSGFFSVLNADGSELDYSTYLGGSAAPDPADPLGPTTIAADVAVDGDGNAHVAGKTNAADLPVGPTVGPSAVLQPAAAGDDDGFAAKIDPGASGAASRVWATYFGGTALDDATDVAVDAAGNTYLAGASASVDLPLQNAQQAVNNGGGLDGFVAELDPDGAALVYSTFLGGAGNDLLKGIAVDSARRAYVAGNTSSTDFPATAGAFQPARGGDPLNLDTTDAVVIRFEADGSLGYASYLGGATDDEGNDIAVDGAGAAHVTGSSNGDARVVSGFAAFPLIDPFAPTGPQADAFVTKVTPDGSALSFSSTFGGGGVEAGEAIALDGAGGAHIFGSTVSTDFPTRDPLQASNAGEGISDNRDAFVVKLSPNGANAPVVTSIGRRSGPSGTSVAVRGRGLSGATEVRFGAIPATRFVVDSDEQITVEAPERVAGPATVTVTTAAGTSPANPIARFTYAEGVWDLTDSLRVGREGGQTATRLADGRVLVAGGQAGGLATGDAEIYDPATGNWSASAPLQVARTGHTATLLADGRVLVTGGSDADGNRIASAEIYNPASGGWSLTTAMGTARIDHTATALANGRVLVTGGNGADFETLGSYEIYDPESRAWSSLQPLGRPRSSHSATLLGGPQCAGSAPPDFCGDVLVVGGFGDDSGTELDDAEIYDAETNTFADVGFIAIPRTRPSITPLADGRVLIAGGELGLRPTRLAELYNPATEQFSTTGLMGVPRSLHAAALLPSGKVLVAGGRTGSSFLDAAELYDPASGRWASAGEMNRYRSSFDPSVFAVPLPGGRVLVGGDARSAGASTELYTPPPLPPAVPGAPILPAAPATPEPPSPATGATAQADRTAPVVSGLRMVPARLRSGDALPRLVQRRTGRHIRFRVSEPAKVRLKFARVTRGRRVGRSCRPARAALRRRPACTRFVAIRPSIRLDVPGALNRVRFEARLSRAKRLTAGRYRLTLTAADRSGNRATPKRTRFVVLRPPRR